ncbi:MAG: pyrroline-5-carboxylate reductase [Rhodospirillales bacterium]|nr:pyrroline-5-carboxylate reductase [Rhodospirillales bacterium]
MKIGIIGTGNIAAAVVRGLCRAKPAPEKVVLSPRNAQKAAALAGEFDMVEVGSGNQAVVDACDLVILAVLPTDAPAITRGLTFRAEQKIISLVAAFRHDVLRDCVSPATDVARAVPLPTVSQHIGPVAVFPNDAETVALFDRIGTAIPVDDEHLYDAMCTVTALAAAHYAFLGHVSSWMVGQGIDRDSANDYVGAIAQALAAEAAEGARHGFDALIKDVSTPGGMNEQVLRMFREADWLAPIDPALDAILARHEQRT